MPFGCLGAHPAYNSGIFVLHAHVKKSAKGEPASRFLRVAADLLPLGAVTNVMGSPALSAQRVIVTLAAEVPFRDAAGMVDTLRRQPAVLGVILLEFPTPKKRRPRKRDHSDEWMLRFMIGEDGVMEFSKIRAAVEREVERQFRSAPPEVREREVVNRMKRLHRAKDKLGFEAIKKSEWQGAWAWAAPTSTRRASPFPADLRHPESPEGQGDQDEATRA